MCSWRLQEGEVSVAALEPLRHVRGPRRLMDMGWFRHLLRWFPTSSHLRVRQPQRLHIALARPTYSTIQAPILRAGWRTLPTTTTRLTQTRLGSTLRTAPHTKVWNIVPHLTCQSTLTRGNPHLQQSPRIPSSRLFPLFTRIARRLVALLTPSCLLPWAHLLAVKALHTTRSRAPCLRMNMPKSSRNCMRGQCNKSGT